MTLTLRVVVRGRNKKAFSTCLASPTAVHFLDKSFVFEARSSRVLCFSLTTLYHSSHQGLELSVYSGSLVKQRQNWLGRTAPMSHLEQEFRPAHWHIGFTYIYLMYIHTKYIDQIDYTRFAAASTSYVMYTCF